MVSVLSLKEMESTLYTFTHPESKGKYAKPRSGCASAELFLEHACNVNTNAISKIVFNKFCLNQAIIYL
jgi:hypothetical protein